MAIRHRLDRWITAQGERGSQFPISNRAVCRSLTFRRPFRAHFKINSIYTKASLHISMLWLFETAVFPLAGTLRSGLFGWVAPDAIFVCQHKVIYNVRLLNFPTMTVTYNFEFEDPVEQACGCCGSPIISLTRFVYRNGDAFAV